MTTASEDIAFQFKAIGREIVPHLDPDEVEIYVRFMDRKEYAAVKNLILMRLGSLAKYASDYEGFLREWHRFRPWSYRKHMAKTLAPIAELSKLHQQWENAMYRLGIESIPEQ